MMKNDFTDFELEIFNTYYYEYDKQVESFFEHSKKDSLTDLEKHYFAEMAYNFTYHLIEQHTLNEGRLFDLYEGYCYFLKGIHCCNLCIK